MPEALSSRYSAVAIILHWTIAALLVANVLLGWQLEDMRGPDRRALMGLHQPIGMSILLLTLVRIAWRAVKKPPERVTPLPPLERLVARVVHTAFYVLLIAMPLSGWITVSASENARPIDLWGLFQIPALDYFAGMERHMQKDAHEVAEETHHLIAKVLVYGLVPLHILGALKHQFIDREDELGRMLPFRTRRRPA